MRLAIRIRHKIEVSIYPLIGEGISDVSSRICTGCILREGGICSLNIKMGILIQFDCFQGVSIIIGYVRETGPYEDEVCGKGVTVRYLYNVANGDLAPPPGKKSIPLLIVDKACGVVCGLVGTATS
jgi:hypothetical protein